MLFKGTGKISSNPTVAPPAIAFFQRQLKMLDVMHRQLVTNKKIRPHQEHQAGGTVTASLL
ncbi:hypothetical protein PVAP13_7NG271500 [Panicum virgatum]|uniref:Uncharacterized protein n=1 Tax=Panicum virgatum TaxID=38727 RepID=A0A8T0Q3C4_PANVG|nr:hypothetical protein PVAP13_7NG271500 [Panicum virgatum]